MQGPLTCLRLLPLKGDAGNYPVRLSLNFEQALFYGAGSRYRGRQRQRRRCRPRQQTPSERRWTLPRGLPAAMALQGASQVVLPRRLWNPVAYYI